MTGDVFSGVQVAGVRRSHDLVMLATHPCSMRGQAAKLKPLLQAVPVRESDRIPLDRWPTGHFRVMPLPELRSDDAHYSAQLDEVGIVDTDHLDVRNRVATLSEVGVQLLQQRYVKNVTRVEIRVETIAAQMDAVLLEAELWEEWNEECLLPRADSPDFDLISALNEERAAFDRTMSAELQAGGPTLRLALNAAGTRPGSRRAVQAAMRDRSSR